MANFQYDLCVVGGAGHVGLPFALVFAKKGLHVAIYDISQAALDTIEKGVVPFIENGAEESRQKRESQKFNNSPYSTRAARQTYKAHSSNSYNMNIPSQRNR